MIETLRKLNINVMMAAWAALILSSITIFSSEAACQSYPTKPIKMIISTAPGSGSDTIARLIGAKLTEVLGQPIIPDNQAGAGGRIGAEAAARSVSDGYTLFMATGAQTILSAMYTDLKYDLIADFAPVTLAGTTPAVLVVNRSFPANSIKELVALAKSRPGALKYGSGGYGSTSHLPGEIFKSRTGTDIVHVPYKAAPAAWTGMLSGEVDMAYQPLIAALPMVRSGKLKALGVTTVKRSSLMPDVPSISEFLPGFEFTMWQGILAPAKTPPAILSKLHSEVVKIIKSSEMRERLLTLGNEPSGMSREEFASFISEQLLQMKEAIKLSGARPPI
jgi:tripartite-type tricarboxylate transporter receptor subunit TctC